MPTLKAQQKPGEGHDAGRVLSQDLSRLLRLRKDDAVINRVYFFPPFAQDMCDALPSLHEAGFTCTTEDTKTQTGDRISAKMRAPDGAELILGTVVLNGTDIEIVDELARLQRVIDFVRQHTPPKAHTQDLGETQTQTIEGPSMQESPEGDWNASPESDSTWQWWNSGDPGWSYPS